MIGSQTMDYYVRPRHLYSHSRTCTRSICVEDLLYWWHLLYATSLIVAVFMIFQLSWLDTSVCQIFLAYGDLDLLYIFSHLEIMILCILYIFIMEIPIYVYCTWRWPHMWFHDHRTLMYPGLLYVVAVICRVVLLYYADCVAGLQFGILHHSTSGMDL